MKHLIRPLACLAVLLSSLSAPALAQQEQQLVAAAAPAAEAPQEARPALWKVADEDTTIWLFGTIHALPPGIDWFEGRIAEAFDGSQELVTEIAGTDPLAVQQLVLSKGKLPEGQTLREIIPPEVKASYERELASLGIPAELFDGYEPWFAAITLTSLPLVRAGYDSKNGVEQALDARAKELGRLHVGLETPEYQIGLFDSLPPEAQQAYFAEVVEQLPTVPEEIAKIVSAWRTGDAEGLAQLMNAEENDPVLVEVLLTNRNKAWAAWLKRRLEEPGAVFVAVGAGHLAGPGSVQEQLAEQGVPAQRVQ